MDLKAALFRKQQEYKKEKSSVNAGSVPSTSTVAAAQNAVEKAGRKVSEKVNIAQNHKFYQDNIMIKFNNHETF